MQSLCTGQSGLHTGQSGGLPSTVPLELAVRAIVPGAPDSPACGTGQSGVPPDSLVLLALTVCRQHFFFSWTLLDLHNVFF
jgi:hypothetical protein